MESVGQEEASSSVPRPLRKTASIGKGGGSPEMSLRSSTRLSTLSTDSSRLEPAIQHFRQRFEKDGLRKCSPLDAHRIMEEDWWLGTFLLCYNCDVDVVLAVVAECTRWRNSFRVELWIRMREHLNGSSDTERLFVFWLERHFTETRASPLTVVIDMSSTTLVNLDYNLFKFMLRALKYYYPNCVEDMVIVESPAILNASWKVIRSWVDVGHPQLHSVTRDSISQFVPSSSLPISLGGEDPFVFSMEELARCMPSRETLAGEAVYEDAAAPDLDHFPHKRSVKFESEDEEATRRAPLVIGMPPIRRSSKVGGGRGGRGREEGQGPGGRRSLMPSALRPLADRRAHAPSADWATHQFVAVSPREELCLSRLEDSSTDLVDIVAVRNSSDRPLLFKIKTTSPEKFRVRPSAGRVGAGATEIVRVYLQNEYRATASKEKFLLMALLSDSTIVDEFADLWNTAVPSSRAEHKLRCRVVDDDSSSNGSSPVVRRPSVGQPGNEVTQLRAEVALLSSSHKMLAAFVAFLVLLQFMFILSERSNSESLRKAIESLAASKNSQ